jgi:hypothetical protein
MAYDYADMEGYKLQPTKSVALNIKAKPNKRSLNTREFKLGAQTMPTVVCITSWNNQNNIAERQHD